MFKKASLMALVCALTAGCSTTFNAVAPGPNNTVYVAGSYQGQAAMWVCPSGGPGECRRVELETGE